jgi:hypothetical protein
MVFLLLGYDSFTLQRGRRKQTNGQNRTTGKTGSTSLGLSHMVEPNISDLAHRTRFLVLNKKKPILF